MQNPNFLADNQHSSRKSRVLIWNINAPTPTHPLAWHTVCVFSGSSAGYDHFIYPDIIIGVSVHFYLFYSVVCIVGVRLLKYSLYIYTSVLPAIRYVPVSDGIQTCCADTREITSGCFCLLFSDELGIKTSQTRILTRDKNWEYTRCQEMSIKIHTQYWKWGLVYFMTMYR